MADKEVVLLDLLVSPFAMRVRIALAEKGIGYESSQEDFYNKSPLLLEMNPVHKQIPVLIHKGRPISESSIIVEYIDEVWNHKSPLLPSHPYQRAYARFWVDYIDKKIYPIVRKLWECKGEEKEAAKKELVESFKVLDGELGDKSYFVDESFGIVDIALIPFSTFFYTFETLANFSMVSEFPKLVAWSNRCLQRETVSKSLCDQYQVYKVILKIKKELGVE